MTIFLMTVALHGCSTRQWINNEPCGLFCGSMTYVLVIYGMYATTVSLFSRCDIFSRL